MQNKKLLKSEQQMQQFASSLLQDSQRGEDRVVVFLLNGDLGSGKTQFAKGIAQALGINQPVRSPSFTYLREYRFNEQGSKLLHYDLWRTDDEIFKSLQIEEQVVPGDVVIVEWAAKEPGLFVKPIHNTTVLNLDFEVVDESTRSVIVH